MAGRHDTTSTGIVASTGNLPLVSTGGFDQTSKSPCESISVFCCFQLLSAPKETTSFDLENIPNCLESFEENFHVFSAL